MSLVACFGLSGSVSVPTARTRSTYHVTKSSALIAVATRAFALPSFASVIPVSLTSNRRSLNVRCVSPNTAATATGSNSTGVSLSHNS